MPDTLKDKVLRAVAAATAAWKGNRASMANYALDAARIDDAWGYTPYPLRANDEWDSADLLTTYQRARALYANCAPIRCAVDQMVQYAGVLTPLPETADEEWNDLALEAWNRRTQNPHTFDLAGRVTYRQAMRFCERCAVIDGDVAVVLTYAPDGGAAFKFVRAPQIGGGGVHGVEADKHGRPLAYYLRDDDGEAKRVPAWYAMLYQHKPDPTRLRGHTMLAAALRNGRDILTIVGYTKQGVKLAASMGLVCTKSDKGGTDFGASFGGGKSPKGAPKADPRGGVPKVELGTGLQITTLPEGRDLKAISDTRPSQQLQTFFEFLVRCIAQAVSLDPEMLFTTNSLGSAAVRFSLEKLRRYQLTMAEDQAVLANRMWRHVIACEIKAGRLRPCRDDAAAYSPRLVQDRDMTIDLARVARSQIDMVRELMSDNEDFVLRTTGRTPRQIAKRRAAEIAMHKKVAAEYGLTHAELCPQQVGSMPQAAPPEPVEGEEEGDKMPAREENT